MDIKSLMIGDWVIFHDSGYASDGTTWEENRVCQIDSIDEDVRVKWYDENGCKEYETHVSAVFLSPIPLTAEILEKNGFEKALQVSDTEPFDTDEEGNKHYSYNKTFWGWWQPNNIFSIPANGLGWLNIKYVHQLQHALRLCGISKEIEL